MNSLQDVARQAAERQSEVLVEIGGNWLHSVADAVLAAVLAEQAKQWTAPAVTPLSSAEQAKKLACSVLAEQAKEAEPQPTFSEYRRVVEALNLCLAALERHDGWCGHKKDSPGDSIYRRATDAARKALWPAVEAKTDTNLLQVSTPLAPQTPEPQWVGKDCGGPWGHPSPRAVVSEAMEAISDGGDAHGFASVPVPMVQELTTIAQRNESLIKALRNCYLSARRKASPDFTSQYSHIVRFCQEVDRDGDICGTSILRESAPLAPAVEPAPTYPCADCGVLRTKDEGGTTFTVCDECWDKHYPPQPPAVEPPSAVQLAPTPPETETELVAEAVEAIADGGDAHGFATVPVPMVRELVEAVENAKQREAMLVRALCAARREGK